MRAAAIDRFGGPEVLTLHRLPVPVTEANEVLIAVDTAGIAIPHRENHVPRHSAIDFFNSLLGVYVVAVVVACYSHRSLHLRHSGGSTMGIIHEVPKPPPLVLVIMGVSGSGKTTVGAMLAGRLHWWFADADDFHSAANVAKMHSGIPLDDEDRMPWLQAIAEQIDRWRADKQHGVVTCSALKQRYREIIVGERPDVRLVYLKGDRPLIARRLVTRHGHFMPSSLLESQLEGLEEPTPEERALTIWVGKAPAVLVDEIIAALGSDTSIIPRDAPDPIRK